MCVSREKKMHQTWRDEEKGDYFSPLLKHFVCIVVQTRHILELSIFKFLSV